MSECNGDNMSNEVNVMMPAGTKPASFQERPPTTKGLSAEGKLLAAWKHVVAEPHGAHELALVVGIENHAVDEQTKQKRPHDAVYRAKCSCGEILRVDLAAVVEHTDGAAS